MLAVIMPDIGDQQDFGKARQQILLDDVDFEFAEAGAEFDMPLVGQLLAAKHDDDVVVEARSRSRGMWRRRCPARDRSRFAHRRLRRIFVHASALIAPSFALSYRTDRPSSHVLKPYEVRFHAHTISRNQGSRWRRILLAEPDRAIREFIAGILTEFGHDVQICENAVDANVWLATAPIDVLVTDMVLRGNQGVDLSRCSAAPRDPDDHLDRAGIPRRGRCPERSGQLARKAVPVLGSATRSQRGRNSVGQRGQRAQRCQQRRLIQLRRGCESECYFGAQWPARYLPCFA